MRGATASVSAGAISCMSASRLASVADSWSPAGRSATRARIGSGSVSWRRRLCALRARCRGRRRRRRSGRSRAGRRGPASSRANCACWSASASSSRGWPGPGCAGSPRGRARGRAAARSGCATGASPSKPALPASWWLALGGEQPALAVVERPTRAASGSGRRPMQGRSWPVRISMPASALDAVGGDVAARVGGQLEVLERDALERAVDAGARDGGDVEERRRRAPAPGRGWRGSGWGMRGAGLPWRSMRVVAAGGRRGGAQRGDGVGGDRGPARGRGR